MGPRFERSMSTLPLNPPSVTSSGRGELPAYVSNGLVGLRVRDVPLDSGMAIVSGLSGEHPVTRVEAAARAPYPLAGDLQLGRVWLSDAPQCVRFVRQDYDFSCGELHTTFIFEVEDQRAQLEVTTFCSRSHPTLALQEVQVEVDQACDIVFRSVIDPAGVHGRWLRRNIGTPGQAEAVVDGSLLWEALGGLSTCGVAYVSELVGAENASARGTNGANRVHLPPSTACALGAASIIDCVRSQAWSRASCTHSPTRRRPGTPRLLSRWDTSACGRKTARPGASCGAAASCSMARIRAGRRWPTRHFFI